MNIVHSGNQASIRAALAASSFFRIFWAVCITVVMPSIVFGDTTTPNEKIAEHTRRDRDYENLPEHIKKERDTLYNVNIDFIKNMWTEHHKTWNAKSYIKQICYKNNCKASTYINENRAFKKESDWGSIANISIHTNLEYIGSFLFCSYRTQYNDHTYEYWLLNMYSDSALLKKENLHIRYKYCEFFITKSKSIKDEREIVFVSDRFFKEFKVDDNFTLIYPEDLYLGTFMGHGFNHCPFEYERHKEHNWKYIIVP